MTNTEAPQDTDNRPAVGGPVERMVMPAGRENEMRVKLKPVRVFEVIGHTGRLEYLQQVGDDWNDMIELRDSDGKKLILARTSGIMSQALSEILGDGTSDWTVISGAPSLLHTLGLPPTGEEQA